MVVRICFCTMCGIPASGKSSFCDRLDQSLMNDYLVIHINYDKILLTSNADKIQLHESLLLQNQEKTQDSVYKTSRLQILQMVEFIIQNLQVHGCLLNFGKLEGLESINKDIQESFLSSCKGCLSNNAENISDIILLIDDNLYLSSMRYEFYKLARKYETGFCEIFMDSSIENALERNKKRKGRDFIDENVIHNMAQRLEPPDRAKNHWEKYSIKVTTEQMTDIVHPMIKEAFENPVQPLPLMDEEELASSRAACSKNIVHQADLILRQCVAKTIVDGKKDSKDVRSLSKLTMAVKDDIMNGLKRGYLNIPFDESLMTVHDASKDENCDLYKYLFILFTDKLKANK